MYTPGNRGVLTLSPNAGLTFNLDAIREAQSGKANLARFHAVVGVPVGPADVWVLVDGQLKLHRANLNAGDLAVPIDVAIPADGKFLTLVSTTESKSNDSRVVVGDPVLLVATPRETPMKREKAETHIDGEERRGGAAP
jgi:hypothetical protein